MYVYVQKKSNWISYSYGGLFRLGYYILNLRIFESSRIISRWGCAPVSINLSDSATFARRRTTSIRSTPSPPVPVTAVPAAVAAAVYGLL